MPEPKVKLLLVAIHPYQVMLDACTVVTALMKRPENNFQLTVENFIRLYIFEFRLASRLFALFCSVLILSFALLSILYYAVEAANSRHCVEGLK